VAAPGGPRPPAGVGALTCVCNYLGVAIKAIHYTDPGCPWAYSASPALAVLFWRYGAELDWRLVTIGLTESGAQYERRGYTPTKSARGYRGFRRFGMPLATDPRRRIPGTSRACRAIVATRLGQPEHEYAAFRALQFGWFTTPLVLDEDQDIAAALERVPGLDVASVVGAIDDPEVVEAYSADRAEARTAAGGPTEFQGKAANTDGAVRFTAPSVVFESADGARRLEAGGFQPVEAYDVLIANLDPALPRRDAPADPLEALAELPFGLTTQEVAAVMTRGNDAPDRAAAEDALIELVATGAATRLALGDDALWVARDAAAGASAAAIAPARRRAA
jgi:2-hydroxychromene-2-carboxylate isomerase